MQAEELVGLLRNKYSGDGYVVLEQVANATGWDTSRWIDAVVFALWPSKGLSRAAFEIKVSRHDFLNELQHPDKHQWARDSFHEFWILAPRDIVAVEELSEGMGLMYPHGKKLAIKRHAKRNDNPILDDSLLASFMRSASKEIISATKTSTGILLEESREYQEALVFQKGVHAFYNKRLGYLHDIPKTIEDIVKLLEGASADKEIAQDRDHLLSILHHFQHNILGLFSVFAIVANKALLERDEAGRHLVDSYGGYDAGAVESIREKIKKDKYKHDGAYLEALEVLMNWDKEIRALAKKC